MRHKGIAVEFADGTIYTVPPLTLGQIDRRQDALGKLQSGNVLFNKEDRDTAVDVIHAALQRNYPDLTPEHVRDELLDAANIQIALAAVMGASGLVERLKAAGASP
jgi:hypothetical protein